MFETGPQTTAVLPFSDFAYRAPPPPATKISFEPQPAPRKLAFMVPGSRKRIERLIEDELHVGRAGTTRTDESLFDLTPFQGAEKGVSRQHAVFKNAQEGVVLIDLNSTNGTLLNTYRLSPQEPYLVHNGDEVRFGDLLVHVFWEDGAA